MFWKRIYFNKYTFDSFLNLPKNIRGYLKRDMFELVVQLKLLNIHFNHQVCTNVSSTAQGILYICFSFIKNFDGNTNNKFVGECLVSFLQRITS